MKTIYKRIIQLFSLLCCFLFFSSASTTSTYANARTTVHILDVGQGLCVLIESDGHYMLYDGGDSSKSSFVVSYLKNQGVKSLDYVIASHFDADHLNGVVGALNAFPVSQVFSPDYTSDSRVFQSFCSVISEKQIPNHQPEVGSVFPLGNASFQILAPTGKNYENENDHSIAIRLWDGSSRFLITGDAELQSEQEMLASGLPLDCNVYVLGHHGSQYSTSPQFLQRTYPQFAVVSCGKDNSFGHPHSKTLNQLQDMNIQLLRTDEQGTLIASTDGTSITWNVSPCNDYTPGSGSANTDISTRSANIIPDSNATVHDPVISSSGSEYVINMNSKKFHLPQCNSVKAMKEKNKKYTSESRESLISQGYEPCKNCNP